MALSRNCVVLILIPNFYLLVGSVPNSKYSPTSFNIDIKPNPTNLFNFQYPDVRRDPAVVDEYFGTTVHDYYRWLEDPDSVETEAFVRAQNNLTIPYLEKVGDRELIRKHLEKSLNYTKYSVPKKRGNHYFTFVKTGLQNQGILYVQDGLNGEPRELIDPNHLSDDGTVAITVSSPSEDGEILAYGLSSKGSDWVTVHFRNVSSGKDLPDVLRHSKWPGVEWNKDNSGVFYSGYPKPNGTADGSETTSNENMKVFYHKLGTDQEDDIVIVEFPEFPKRTVSAEITDDDKYLIVSSSEGLLTNLVHYIEMKPIIDSEYTLEKPTLKPLLVNDDAKHHYVASSVDGSVLYFRTNKGASNYRIIGIYLDNIEEKYWATLLPENPKDVLKWASRVDNDKLVTCYMRDVKSVLEVRRLRDGSLLKEIDIGVAAIRSFSSRIKESKFFYSLGSFLTPGKIFLVDLAKKGMKPVIFRESVVPGLDSSLYTAEQVFYKSKDGTQVPMFIVHKKDLVMDGTAPTFLYGYGGFDISILPSFSDFRVAYMQLFNGVIAIPNIRGGGEYGARWHDGGRLLNKQNSYDDFQSAAEYLIRNNYTSSPKLTIHGVSNGGLLIGVSVNQRPELFGAAIAQVGVLDLLRYHKFTIGYTWATDYGTSDNETEFHNLIKISPLHNVHVPKDDRVQYPATLVMTGDHDDRVVPLHSYKFISELQWTVGRCSHQTNPLLILIETNAGHGSGKPTKKRISEAVDMFSFLIQTLNLKIVQPLSPSI